MRPVDPHPGQTGNFQKHVRTRISVGGRGEGLVPYTMLKALYRVMNGHVAHVCTPADRYGFVPWVAQNKSGRCPLCLGMLAYMFEPVFVLFWDLGALLSHVRVNSSAKSQESARFDFKFGIYVKFEV